MKMLNNGLQVEILKVFRNASNNTKLINGLTVHTDLLRVKLSDGKIIIIDENELNNQKL